jgi:putative endonuclease
LNEDANPDPARRKRRALSRGRFAEWLAANFLRMKGYRIAARNFRTRAGEIDIVARRRDLVIFVEVKARGDAQRRIAAAAEIWIARQRDHARLSWRFDIVAVTPLRLPRHFEDAF